MCELLGMSANVPTDICFSFSGLMERGGHTGPHADGWGIAFYDGKGARTFHDPKPSCNSQIAQLVKTYSIKSCIVISHIRKANRGRVCLENTHPFIRELWGRNWTFAHNGQLKNIKKKKLTYYLPIGTTDSEHAFCWMLGQLRERFPKPPRNPKTLSKYIKSLTHELNALGVFNMLLSDSNVLYAHCSNHLSWITRRAPFGKAQLIDTEMTVNFAERTLPNDVVTVITTRPLTNNEDWTIMDPDTLAVFDQGEITLV